MKSIIYLGPVLVFSVSCMEGFPERRATELSGSTTTQGEKVASSTRLIKIDPSTKICVNVDVDPVLWTKPVDSGVRTGMGLFLARNLQASLAKRGVIVGLSNFRSNPDGNIPECTGVGVVKINLKYELHENRSPFLVSQIIKKDHVSISDVFKRDIKSEWAAGSLPRLQKSNDIQAAISDDLEKRAEALSFVFHN